MEFEFGGAIERAQGGLLPERPVVSGEGFSIPNDVEPGDDHEVVAVPGDMPTMNEGRRNTGGSKAGLLLHDREGHCTASFINQTNDQVTQDQWEVLLKRKSLKI